MMIWETIYFISPLSLKLQSSVPRKYKIGIAILAYERPEYLEVCLDSIFKTNLYNHDVTFLIQDDGSRDPRVNKIINKERDAKYKIIRSFTVKGKNSWKASFSKAIRKLIEIDKFDIVGTLDSDIVFHPEWLNQMICVCFWAKKNHKKHNLGPFSPFNSSEANYTFGKFSSPYGDYNVKERVSSQSIFFYTSDLKKINLLSDKLTNKSLFIEKLTKLKIRSINTDISYVEHVGANSILDIWRKKQLGILNVHAFNLKRGGWSNSKKSYDEYPNINTNKSFVILVHNGGLGDHLFHSHIPRIAKNIYGFNKVYVSNSSNFRDEQYKNLVWELNPYVDGFSDEKIIFKKSESINSGSNILDKIMLSYGLDDGNRWHEPELYFEPPILQNFTGKNIYDPNYVSPNNGLSKEKIQKFFLMNQERIHIKLSLREKFFDVNNISEIYTTKSLEDFCSLIVSCKMIYCVLTGTATLAAALNKSATVLYGSKSRKKYLHSRMHKYIYL